MLNSSVGATGEWLSAGGENGFPQELCRLLLRLLLWGNCPHFFPPNSDSHRGVQKQCFLLLIDRADMYSLPVS